MRHAANFMQALSACLLALAVSAWLPGCGNDSRPTRPGPAGLQVRLVFPDKKQDQRTEGSLAPASVQNIRVSAWELPAAAAPRILRGQATATIAPTDTRFRLELQVPPAALYLLLVEAEGTLEVTPNPMGAGLLFFGADSVANVNAGETRTVEIRMPRVVPVLTKRITTRDLSLHWDRVDRAIRYGLLELPDPPAWPREIFTRSTDTLIVFPPTKAEAPQRRSYRVRAEFPDSLFSAFSESVEVSIPKPIAPARIEDLVVMPETATATELQLEWTATGDDSTVGQARTYYLRRSASPITTEDAFAAATRIDGVPTPQTSGQRERFTVTGLAPATDYYFAIRAADDVPTWSPVSNTARGATLPLPPDAPQDLGADAISDTAIRLHWTDRATNEARYRIQRQSPTDPQFVLAGIMVGSFTGTVEYKDSTLAERTTYHYRVRAENSGGVSAWSNEVVQRTRVARPTKLAATAVAPDSVALTWRYPLPHPTDGFRLERRTGSAGYTEIGRPAPADRAFSDADVQPLTTYTYRLRAADAGDLSDPSDSVEVTTPDLPPACLMDPAALNFGTVFVGSSLDRSFTIQNIGGRTLTGTLATTCPAFSIIIGSGDFSLGAGESWQVIVRFSPASPGAVQCVITPSDRCSTVACSGTGEARPLCSVVPTSLDFGTVIVGADSTQTFTITNIGGGTLSGSVGGITPRTSYSIVSGGGTFDLVAGQSRVVTIRFSPTVEQPPGCTVTLGTTGCSSVSCTGTGEAHPICTVDPAGLDFGIVPIGTTADMDFTITNTGGGTLTGGVAATCDKYFSVVSGDGSFSLGTGASHAVTMRFTARSTAPSSCLMSLGGTAAAGCDLLCTGTGLGPVCSVSPTALDFGPIEAGERATRTFTVTNIGGDFLTGTIFVTCPNFVIDAGDGAYDLGPGVSRTVTVAYAPSAPGVHSCRVETGCKDGVSCAATATDPNDHWWSGFSGNAPNGAVNTLALHGSNLAVGGNFTAVGNSPTGRVAWWNGAWTTNADLTTWNNVDVLQTWGGPLGQGSLVAASFASGHGGSTSTARWQNDTWVFLGEAPQFYYGAVKAFATWQTELFAGGAFTYPISRLGRWNGTSWEAADQGLTGGGMNDLEAFGPALYATGSFAFPSGAVGGAIYRLDGSSWVYLTSSLNTATGPSPLTSARKLVTHAGALYAIVGAGPGDYVARLDGTTLVAVGETVDGMATDLASDGTRLYVVGTFARMEGAVPSGVYMSGAASWDGTTWRALGSGISGGTPTVVLPFGGSIYVGGDFTTAGGKDSPHIARWTP